MKTLTLTLAETRALLILNEYLQAHQVEGSHRFNDYLPLIETALDSISTKLIFGSGKQAA